MERSIDIIDMLHGEHVEAREKGLELVGLFTAFDRHDVWDKIDGIMTAFDRRMFRHFEAEEVVSSAPCLDRSKLADDEQQVLFEIRAEHKTMLSGFKQLYGIEEEFMQGNREVGGAFMALANEIFDKLLIHIAQEDAFLIPLLRKHVPGEKLAEYNGILREGRETNGPGPA